MKLKIEKVQKYVATLHYKTEYVTHIRSLKQELNNGLVFKKFIEWLSNQHALLKPYIDMNTDLRKKQKLIW